MSTADVFAIWILLSSLTLQVFYMCGAHHFPSLHTNQISVQVEDEHRSILNRTLETVQILMICCWHKPACVNTRSWGSRSRAPALRWPWAPSSVATSAFQGRWKRAEQIFCFLWTHAASLLSFYWFDILVFAIFGLSQIESKDLVDIHLKLRGTRRRKHYQIEWVRREQSGSMSLWIEYLGFSSPISSEILSLWRKIEEDWEHRLWISWVSGPQALM